LFISICVNAYVRCVYPHKANNNIMCYSRDIRVVCNGLMSHSRLNYTHRSLTVILTEPWHRRSCENSNFQNDKLFAFVDSTMTVTSQRQDTHLRLFHLRNSMKTTEETARRIPGLVSLRISGQTVRRRLRQSGLRVELVHTLVRKMFPTPAVHTITSIDKTK
jgi:hypothetical protein